MTLFCRFFTWLWEFLLSKTLYLSSWDCVYWSLSLKLSKGKGFCLFYWPFIVHSCFTSCIFAARTLDFAVKFRLVFRYEAVLFRRYVLALWSVGLLRKFEAYLVYLNLIWIKNPRRFSFFQKFRHFTYMLLWFHLVVPSFPARIDDMRSLFSALSRRLAMTWSGLWSEFWVT